MRSTSHRLRQKSGQPLVMLGWATTGKVGCSRGHRYLVPKGLHAGKLIAQIAPLVGGKGAAGPTWPQAGARTRQSWKRPWTWPGSSHRSS